MKRGVSPALPRHEVTQKYKLSLWYCPGNNTRFLYEFCTHFRSWTQGGNSQPILAPNGFERIKLLKSWHFCVAFSVSLHIFTRTIHESSWTFDSTTQLSCGQHPWLLALFSLSCQVNPHVCQSFYNGWLLWSLHWLTKGWGFPKIELSCSTNEKKRSQKRLKNPFKSGFFVSRML